MCFVRLPSFERTELTAQSVKCAFLGYASHQKGFFFVMIPQVLAFVFLEMSFFFENQCFFSHHNEPLPSFTHLPNFTDEDSSAPLIVYERCRQKDVPLLTPPPDPSPAPNLAPDPASDLTPATSSSQVPLR